jgi:hypothetical protein
MISKHLDERVPAQPRRAVLLAISAKRLVDGVCDVAMV